MPSSFLPRGFCLALEAKRGELRLEVMTVFSEGEAEVTSWDTG